jgi:hypothetical protein
MHLDSMNQMMISTNEITFMVGDQGGVLNIPIVKWLWYIGQYLLYNLPWNYQSWKSFEAMSHKKILPPSLQVWCEGR